MNAFPGSPGSQSAVPFVYSGGTAPTSAALSDVIATVLAANSKRRYAVICNKGAQDCYLSIGTAAEASKGIYLKAGGGTYEINSTNLTGAKITGICAAGESTTVTVLEGI